MVQNIYFQVRSSESHFQNSGIPWSVSTDNLELDRLMACLGLRWFFFTCVGKYICNIQDLCGWLLNCYFKTIVLLQYIVEEIDPWVLCYEIIKLLLDCIFWGPITLTECSWLSPCFLTLQRNTYWYVYIYVNIFMKWRMYCD